MYILPTLRFLLGTLALTVLVCHANEVRAQADTSAGANRKAQATSKAPSAGKTDAPIPTCGAISPQAPSQAFSDHTVILSWKPGAPVPGADMDPVLGYCVYRTTKPDDPSPELINSTPFNGTSCADDHVQHHQTYYYVVKAITARGGISPISNEAPAPIPPETESRGPTSTPAPPLCRGASSSN